MKALLPPYAARKHFQVQHRDVAAPSSICACSRHMCLTLTILVGDLACGLGLGDFGFPDASDAYSPPRSSAPHALTAPRRKFFIDGRRSQVNVTSSFILLEQFLA